MDSLIAFLGWSCCPPEFLLRLERVSIDRRRGLIMRLRGAAADQSQPQSAFMSHKTPRSKSHWEEILVFFCSHWENCFRFTLWTLKCFLSSCFWANTCYYTNSVCVESTPDAVNTLWSMKKKTASLLKSKTSLRMFNDEVNDSLVDWWDLIRAMMHSTRFGSYKHLD